MKIVYDTEFWDNGRIIDPISVAFVAEDGRELYLVNADAPYNQMAFEQPWLVDNVFKHLPWREGFLPGRDGWLIDHERPEVAPRRGIAKRVLDFLREGHAWEDRQTPDLWADFPATDHVLLYQLWGPMVAVPKGVPWRTSCLTQHAEELARRGETVVQIEQDPDTLHHALHDARHEMEWARGMGLVGPAPKPLEVRVATR